MIPEGISCQRGGVRIGSSDLVLLKRKGWDWGLLKVVLFLKNLQELLFKQIIRKTYGFSKYHTGSGADSNVCVCLCVCEILYMKIFPPQFF